MMRRLWFGLLLSLVGIQFSTAAAAPGAWAMTSARFVGDVIGEEYPRTTQPYLAPDGSAVAWNTNSDTLAVYTFEDSNVTFFPAPEHCCALGIYSGQSWSPDARYFTFTEDPNTMEDTDIWMLDRDSGSIVDRTDDGLFGGWQDAKDPFSIDNLPTWNPANGDLYFFRSLVPADGAMTLGLYLLPVDRTEPKRIADLTEQLPPFSTYRPPVISPDGAQIAFAVASVFPDRRNGVWTLDLKTGAPEQIMSPADLWTGLPTWQTRSDLKAEFLQWAGNNALVVLSRDSSNSGMAGVIQMAHYVDLAAQTVTPLTNFEDVEDQTTLYRDDGPGSPSYRIPDSGVAAPDGSAFFFLRMAGPGPGTGISMLPLPPDGSAPVDLGAVEPHENYQAGYAPPTMGSNGRALMYGYVLQFEWS